MFENIECAWLNKLNEKLFDCRRDSECLLDSIDMHNKRIFFKNCWKKNFSTSIHFDKWRISSQWIFGQTVCTKSSHSFQFFDTLLLAIYKNASKHWGPTQGHWKEQRVRGSRGATDLSERKQYVTSPPKSPYKIDDG